MGGGGYAEYATLLDTHAWAKPSHLTFAEAASIPENWVTAFQALDLIGNIKKTDKVLVHAGASGVGVAANQLARYFGCETVFTTASTDEKLAWLKSMKLGATNTVNYKTQDFAEEIKKVTGGKGVDLIIDFVGKSHWEKNISSLAVDGRMVMLSLLSGADPKVNLGPILFKRLRIQGSTLRARTPEYQSELIGRMGTEMMADITGEKGEGPLRTYIYKVYPWTDIQQAHEDMQENKNSKQWKDSHGSRVILKGNNRIWPVNTAAFEDSTFHHRKSSASTIKRHHPFSGQFAREMIDIDIKPGYLQRSEIELRELYRFVSLENYDG